MIYSHYLLLWSSDGFHLQSTYAMGYGAVVDSGTTFTYLPTAAFQKFSKAVDEHAISKGLQRTPGSDPQVNRATLSRVGSCI